LKLQKETHAVANVSELQYEAMKEVMKLVTHVLTTAMSQPTTQPMSQPTMPTVTETMTCPVMPEPSCTPPPLWVLPAITTATAMLTTFLTRRCCPRRQVVVQRVREVVERERAPTVVRDSSAQAQCTYRNSRFTYLGGSAEVHNSTSTERVC